MLDEKARNALKMRLRDMQEDLLFRFSRDFSITSLAHCDAVREREGSTPSLPQGIVFMVFRTARLALPLNDRAPDEQNDANSVQVGSSQDIFS